MYLSLVKRTYKSSFDCGTGLYPEEFKEFEDEISSRNFRSVEVETRCQVGYWRKANAIHKWFVDKCANGVDECQKIYVSKDKLQELLTTCKDVEQNHNLAEELLPTSKGFFFGGVEYNDWYFEDLKYTIDLIEKVLKFFDEHKSEDYRVEYEASW